VPAFGTAEWARALHDEIDGSSEYRNAAAGWGKDGNGNILLAFEADAALPEGLFLLLRLREGRSLGVEFVPGPSHPDASFALRGPFSLWRDVLERRTLAATAILTGRIRVEGDKLALLKHTSAHRALVHCVASVPTELPPRTSP
jgi:putative sterol carrier protein